MELNKNQKYIYYYLRYTLMLHPFVLLFAIISIFFELPWNDNFTDTAILIFAVPIFISFFILPGIIYEDGYEYTWYGFGKNQFHYNLFMGVTLGIGPLYIFFKKYDPILKEYFNDSKRS